MFRHYLKTALRNFQRHKLATAVSVLGLTLGVASFIGALGYFEFVGADDAQYPDAGRVYAVQEQTVAPGINITSQRIAWVVGDYVRADLADADLVARATDGHLESISVGERTIEAYLSFADPEFLQLFPQKFAAGASATALGRPGNVLLTREIALRLFGTDHAVGKTLMVRGSDVLTVGGVIESPPQPSHFGSTESNDLRFDMLASSLTLPALLARRGGVQFADEQLHDPVYAMDAVTYVRLRAGEYSLDRARAAVATLSRRYHMSPWQKNTDLIPVAEIRRSEAQYYDFSTGTLLMALATVVLCVAALNYANLSAAQAISRRRDIGVRYVLGATHRHVAAQVCTDAALAVALAAGLSFALLAATASSVDQWFAVDLTFAWFHLAFWKVLLPVLIGLTLLLCAYPLALLSRLRVATSLQQSRGDAIRPRAIRWLVGAQFLFTTLLLLGVAVIHSQIEESRRRASALVDDPIVVIDEDLEAAGVGFEVLRNALLARPGIASVAATNWMPFSGSFGVSYYIRHLDGSDRSRGVLIYGVTDNYFSALRIPLLAGKSLADIREGSSEVVLARSAAAEFGWTPEQALGQELYGAHMTANGLRAGDLPSRVVGVVEDKLLQTSRIDAASSVVYAKSSDGARKIPLVRLRSGDLAAGRAEVESVWRTLAPRIVPHVQFLDERVEAFFAGDRIRASLLAALTSMTLAIALVGLVAISVQTADRRRFEVGIRKTLGARTMQVLVLLLRDLSLPIVLGNLVAWPLAYWITKRYVDGFAHPPPLTLGLCVASLLLAVGVGWLFAGWSVLRAARVSPAVVLRNE